MPRRAAVCAAAAQPYYKPSAYEKPEGLLLFSL